MTPNEVTFTLSIEDAQDLHDAVRYPGVHTLGNPAIVDFLALRIALTRADSATLPNVEACNTEPVFRSSLPSLRRQFDPTEQSPEPMPLPDAYGQYPVTPLRSETDQDPEYNWREAPDTYNDGGDPFGDPT